MCHKLFPLSQQVLLNMPKWVSCRFNWDHLYFHKYNHYHQYNDYWRVWNRKLSNILLRLLRMRHKLSHLLWIFQKLYFLRSKWVIPLQEWYHMSKKLSKFIHSWIIYLCCPHMLIPLCNVCRWIINLLHFMCEWILPLQINLCTIMSNRISPLNS